MKGLWALSLSWWERTVDEKKLVDESLLRISRVRFDTFTSSGLKVMWVECELVRGVKPEYRMCYTPRLVGGQYPPGIRVLDVLSKHTKGEYSLRVISMRAIPTKSLDTADVGSTK